MLLVSGSPDFIEIRMVGARAQWQRSSFLVSEDSGARQKAPDVAMPVAWTHPRKNGKTGKLGQDRL